MSGYFQRLAQRTGLVATASSRAGARRQMVAPRGAPGLEQEQIVEVPQPGAATAASDERSRNEATTSAGEGERVMPARAGSVQTTRSRAWLPEPHPMSTPVPAPAPAAREAVTPPQAHVVPASAVEEREERASAARATIAMRRELDTGPPGPRAAQRQPVPSPLERSEQRLAARTAPDARAGSARDRPLRPHAADSAFPGAQPGSGPIEPEARTRSRRQSVTEMLGRSLPAQSQTLGAAGMIDVRIGTVAVEIHQAAPQAVAPPPSPVPAPRERFSPSRHYIRMD